MKYLMIFLGMYFCSVTHAEARVIHPDECIAFRSNKNGVCKRYHQGSVIRGTVKTEPKGDAYWTAVNYAWHSGDGPDCRNWTALVIGADGEVSYSIENPAFIITSISCEN